MSDLISRQAAIDALEKSRFPGAPYIDTGVQIAMREIKALPSAQPEYTDAEGEPMDDLISRAEALALAKDIIVPIKDGTVYKYRCIDPDSIKELPSECNVIYCRDCRFYIGYRCQATRGLDDWRNQDDYCSRAERIEHEQFD